MSLISKAISNLLNGVSQQDAASRLPSQAEIQENGYSSPLDNLSKRPATRHIAKLRNGTLATPKIQTLNRDITEQYTVIIENGDLFVYDMAGNQKTVTFPNGKSYLQAVNARDELVTLPLEDYMFLHNRNVRPQLAVVPYLSTDKVQLAVNFGDGQLVEDGVQPLPPTGTFTYAFKGGYTSSSNPEGWILSGGYATYDAAMAAFEAYVKGPGYDSGKGTVSLYESKPIIKQVSGNPEYVDSQINNVTLARQTGIKIVNTSAIYITNSQVNDGQPFNPDLRIIYRNSATNNTLDALKGDVGFPETPYVVPGKPRYRSTLAPSEGSVTLKVNDLSWTWQYNSTNTAAEIAAWFSQQVSAGLPGYTVDLQGAVFNITAPAGKQLWASVVDTSGQYVQVFYTSLAYDESVFIVIRTGVAEQTYAVSLNGNLYQFTTGTSDQASTWTADNIANQLATAINNGGKGFQAAVYGNFIRVTRPDHATISFAYHDTWGNQAGYAMKNQIQSFTDLPKQFVPGFPIQIGGDSATNLGGYWVEWTQEAPKQLHAVGLGKVSTGGLLQLGVINRPGASWNVTEGSNTGTYKECAKPGTPSLLIPATMPHALVRKADGTFEFKELEWPNRAVGDESSAPAPSFVGKQVSDLFFFQNRLGLLSESSFVMTRDSEFFNFFPVSAQQTLPTDPLDLMVASTQACTLRHAVTMQEQLLLFSDNQQFVVRFANATEGLNSITCQSATTYDCSKGLKPALLGQVLFFGAERGGATNLMEYIVRTNAITNSAENITAHVAKYIGGGAYKMATSSTEGVAAVFTDEEPNTMAVYLSLWQNDQKAQESWSKFTFGGRLLNGDFIQSRLYLTVQHDDGVYLEVLDLQPNGTDEGFDWSIRLDRKVALKGVYNAATNTTTWQLPYPAFSAQAVFDAGWERYAGTRVHTLEQTDPAKLVAKGDLSQSKVFVGVPYTFRYRFSAQYLRDNNGSSITGGVLTLRTFTVNYLESGPFTFTVGMDHRTPKQFDYNGRTLGITTPANTFDIKDGAFRVPVGADSRSVYLEVSSDLHYPVALANASWEANWVMRSRRV